MTQTVTIFRYNGYTIESHDNGAAYTLHDDNGASVFIQYGDDATAFREEFDAADAIENAELAMQAKANLCEDLIYAGGI